jgi:CubicO group peptidase (beta-lactamase class C family)
LQQLLDEARAATGSPGAAFIMRDGQPVWQGVSGRAELETGAPVNDTTIYSLASVTKTFTSTMVLRLYEEGRIGLDDFIQPYVPAYVPSTDQVTVRDLLGMTSGYRDVEGFPVILKWLNDPNHIWTRPLARITNAQTQITRFWAGSLTR